jgi:hypothetical protein
MPSGHAQAVLAPPQHDDLLVPGDGRIPETITVEVGGRHRRRSEGPGSHLGVVGTQSGLRAGEDHELLAGGRQDVGVAVLVEVAGGESTRPRFSPAVVLVSVVIRFVPETLWEPPK